MRGLKREIDWQKHDALVAQGVESRHERARLLGVSESTLRGAEKRRESEAQGTPRVPMRVPQETKVPTTAMPPPPATISDLQHLLQEQEARIKAYVEQRIQESIEHQRQLGVPLEVPQTRQRVPIGTPVPEYPDDPHKDMRLNLHLSAAELWEVHVVALAFGMNPSRLIRRVWELFRESPQAKQALEQAMEESTHGG